MTTDPHALGLNASVSDKSPYPLSLQSKKMRSRRTAAAVAINGDFETVPRHMNKQQKEGDEK